MLYTILGGLLGGGATYVLCKYFDIEMEEKGPRRMFPPAGIVLVILGTVACGCIGLGIGANELAHGTHPINKLL